MRRFKPTIWLSFGLVSLTLALALTGYVLGLMPDGYKVELESRAKVAESLAVQLAGAANRNDSVTLEETLSSIVKRNDDVLSSALRRTDGSIVLSAGNHEEHWVRSADGKSTPTHVSVPLFGPEGLQGSIELSFGPASIAKRILGIPATLLMFLGFLMASGFIGYFLLLRRTLRQLDPGRVIPERVQKAFDTLSEGVIILDEKERILLVNEAFAEIYDQKSGPAIGSKINTLSWRMVDGSAKAGGYPWHTAIREGREMRHGLLSLRTTNGSIHNFNVNATVITDDKSRTIGAIVTLSDTTNLKRSNEELQKTSQKLQQSEEHAEHQGKELAYLNSHDSLSGCLNRRTFFQRLETDLDNTAGALEQIAILMVDLDCFAELNRNYGVATGDRVITEVAEILRSTVGASGYVSRHGDDQFCIALPEATLARAEEIDTALRAQIADHAHRLLAGGAKLTISGGLTHGAAALAAAQTLINQADEALKFAKSSGRNKTVRWVPNLKSESVGDAPAGGQQVAAFDNTALPVGNETDGLGQLHQKLNQFASETTTSREDFDGVAGISDLARFMSGVDRTLAIAATTGKQTAILQVSVESWDYLFEALGNTASQNLMKAIKRRATDAMRQCDEMVIIGNTGELLINIMEISNRNDLSWMIGQLLDSLRAPIKIEGQEIYVACNAGVALFPDNGGNSSVLVSNAGTAMRRAREENKVESFKFYSAEMTLSSQERLDIESGIREALQRDEFELFFQPIVDLKTGALSAAECLLRCNNKYLSGVRMDKVIGVAEKSSLIAEIDMWVLNTALTQMQTWCDVGLSLPKISINISATQFTNIEFMDRVFDTIKAAQFSPSRVQIEVTETAKMADVNIAAPQLKRLQQLGVMIALDDFGTGQASLTYLQRLHPDVIKIDRSFVTGVNTNHANATLVSAMTVMAHCLGLKVVVEGVEDEEECEFLRQTRCDEMQGYFVSKPMPAGVMSDWMSLFVRNNGTTAHLRDVQPPQITNATIDVDGKAA